MALQILGTDPEAFAKSAPKPEYDHTVDFQFRAGMVVPDAKGKGRPVSLKNWRVTAAQQDVAEAVAQLLGGSVDEWETSKDDNLQVLTETNKVEVVIDSSDAIEDKLIQWGPNGGAPIHECDGVVFLSGGPEEVGQPCGCPKLLKDRKRNHKRGTGPGPSITVKFRLAHDYDLGKGQFVSGSWLLAAVIHEVRNDLDKVDGPALATIELEANEFVNDDGELIKFKKPVIKVVGSYNDAIADERD
jgi:hypothetical protein